MTQSNIPVTVGDSRRSRSAQHYLRVLPQSWLTTIRVRVYVTDPIVNPWLGLQFEGLHYAQTGVIEQE